MTIENEDIKYPGCAPHIISSRALDAYVGDRVFMGPTRSRSRGMLEINDRGDYILIDENQKRIPIRNGDVVTLQTERLVRSYIFNKTE